MTPRAAAVAFAASALFIAPATAQQRDHGQARTSAAVQFQVGNGLSVTLGSGNVGLATSHNGGYHHRNVGNYGYRDYHLSRSPYHIRRLRRDAVDACEIAVRREARSRGLRGVRLEDVERIQQIAPAGFRVRAEFEAGHGRRSIERDVVCTVRQGRVVNLDVVPNYRGDYNSGYRKGHRGYRGY